MGYRTSALGFGGYQFTPVVKKLLISNVAVFLVTSLIIPEQFVREWLAFQPDHVLTRPWGAFTYMFVHDGIGHLFGNMLVLFFFGSPLETEWGSNEFFRYYLVCGFGGVVLSFLLAPSAGIVGASAAAYGVMLAFAMAWPDAQVYVWGIFPIPVKVLVGILFLISLVPAFQSGGVAHAAHLGGFLTGLAYLKADWRPQEKLAALKKRSQRAARRLAIVPRDEEPSPPAPLRAGGWRTADEGALLDAVDRVLDKISAEGISALTPEERGVLDEVSRRHQTAK
ncbi:MAG: rhomboid family intramembrane serine protease [Gemmatimonadetes bacterium]|nr:rhomboid family intramembrane serine protease [Gemmatimonadota bacterium]